MLTVHHLNFSRSTWVLWLREQIGRDYRLQTDIRTPGFAALQSLSAVHPLTNGCNGRKAPQLAP
jgi:glutathione S-transferase